MYCAQGMREGFSRMAMPENPYPLIDYQW